MENYKFRPLTGLLEIKKEEVSNADILNTLSYAEEKINSSPKGRVTQLALLFYLLNILRKAGLSFYVKGGIIQHYYLEERSRPTYDLDIIIDDDSDAFVSQIECALISHNDAISFRIKNHEKTPADNIYYYDTFNVEIEVIIEGQECARLHIDGVVDSQIFKKIKPLEYEMPEIIAPNMKFIGVPIEYVMAEKIIAITNELVRPYKHLVDMYGLMNLDIDFDLLNKYLSLIVDNDNMVRARLKKEVSPYLYQIKKDKEFAGSYIFTALQAGYNIPVQDMIKAVNKWLKKMS